MLRTVRKTVVVRVMISEQGSCGVLQRVISALQMFKEVLQKKYIRRSDQHRMGTLSQGPYRCYLGSPNDIDLHHPPP